MIYQLKETSLLDLPLLLLWVYQLHHYLCNYLHLIENFQSLLYVFYFEVLFCRSPRDWKCFIKFLGGKLWLLYALMLVWV